MNSIATGPAILYDRAAVMLLAVPLSLFDSFQTLSFVSEAFIAAASYMATIRR